MFSSSSCLFIVENDHDQQSKIRYKSTDNDAEIETIQKLIEKIIENQA